MQIELSRWSEYLAELSRQAEGYSASIEVMSDELGYQVEARNVPLSEITFDLREGISISVGSESPKSAVALRHVIGSPRGVEVTDAPGVPSALMIDGDDGTRTLVRLAPPG